MTDFCLALFVPSASPTCCSRSTPAEGIRYCRPLATGRCRLRATRLSRPLPRFCAWDGVLFAPVRVPERQLLRATHSYSGSRTGCLALFWPSVRVRFLILGDILSYLHTALSFPKFSPKSAPRRSAADLVRFKLLDTQCPCYHNTPGRRGVARIPNVRSDYHERSDVYHRLGTSLKAVLGCQAWGDGFACMRSDVNSMKLSF